MVPPVRPLRPRPLRRPCTVPLPPAPVSQQRPAPAPSRPAPVAAPTIGALDKFLAIAAAIVGLAAVGTVGWMLMILKDAING